VSRALPRRAGLVPAAASVVTRKATPVGGGDAAACGTAAAAVAVPRRLCVKPRAAQITIISPCCGCDVCWRPRGAALAAYGSSPGGRIAAPLARLHAC